MTAGRDDKLSEREFDEFLAGRSPVASGYERLRDVEPPANLDRAVLTEARVAAAGSRRRPSFWSLWSSRVAAAAVVVLAVGVTLRLAVGPGERPLSEGSGSAAAQRDDGEPAATVIDRPAFVTPLEPSPPPGEQRYNWSASAEANSTSAEELESLVSAPQAYALEPARPMSDETAKADEAGTAFGPAGGVGARRSPPVSGAGPMETVTVTGSSLADASPAPWRARPKAWLTRIDALIEDGEDEAARSELAEFVDAWPEYELDEAYDDWLPEPNPDLP